MLDNIFANDVNPKTQQNGFMRDFSEIRQKLPHIFIKIKLLLLSFQVSETIIKLSIYNNNSFKTKGLDDIPKIQIRPFECLNKLVDLEYVRRQEFYGGSRVTMK